MSCGVGHGCGLDPTLLWLWHRPVATAPIRPLAWEVPYATGTALERTERQKKKKYTVKFTINHYFELFLELSFKTEQTKTALKKS